MKLTSFRIRNFRSVVDSGWIETDEITALIGTNESGKTNLLVPLWKLKPAKDGEIDAIQDYPRKRYNEIRAMKEKPVFITARFELDDALAKQVATLTEAEVDDVRVAEVSRDFGGKYRVGFPEAAPARATHKEAVVSLLVSARTEIEELQAGKSEEGLKAEMLAAVNKALTELDPQVDELTAKALQAVAATLVAVDTSTANKRSTIEPRYGALQDEVDALLGAISKPHPQENADARQLVLDNMPPFVYYSNYGNLDSEIYLPHVIENMSRTDLGLREQAKARTLKVLFDFVNLKPQEILELGRDLDTQQGRPTEEQIAATARKKTEREILLQSAGTSLTDRFRNWWKQGDYRFRFQADGNHFRIWVSDDKRPEEIELEGRSTGLQWFLSFYLVFLVESAEGHKGAILLLDEPGLSLHPIAQRDLSLFFQSLASTNQLLYTTHSPFLVDPDHLDRVKAVYVDKVGATAVSSDLRSADVNPEQVHSIYPVHAAIGLRVSDTLLLGCEPVVVEGQSDQVYMSGIKTYLIRKGLFHPSAEMVFVPAKGTRSIRAIAAILASSSEQLPHVLLDSDADGRNTAKGLQDDLYSGACNHVTMVEEITALADSEMEDLFPIGFLADVIAKYLRRLGIEEDFDEVVAAGMPILPQVEAFAAKSGVHLPNGWKVEVARKAKERLLGPKDPVGGDQVTLDRWVVLFSKLES